MLSNTKFPVRQAWSGRNRGTDAKRSMMGGYSDREPPIKKVLYWCPVCNLPLIAKTCACKAEGTEIPLQKPYDLRPALEYDHSLLLSLLHERFGIESIPKVVLFNKTGGIDRNDLVIMNGVKAGLLTFDPVSGRYNFDISFDILPYLLPQITKGIVDITDYIHETGRKRLGGKKVPVDTDLSDGCVVVRGGSRHGVGILKDGVLKVKQIGHIEVQADMPDPEWPEVVSRNRRHLKNLERNAVRNIRSSMKKRKNSNVSFSGGKDSTVVLELARKAGIEDSYYVDTGLEFPETNEFVRSMNIPVTLHGGDFWKEIKRSGLPRKDDRWCCRFLKLMPVKEWLDKQGECVTVQGNRWYESFARSTLPGEAVNPANPRQLNISPIRNWRALEVFLYLWWRKLPYNPLYDLGFERVGCWLCPAMLESESIRVRELHPDLYGRWQDYLKRWAEKQGLSEAYCSIGFWRWKEHPPKMVEIAEAEGIALKASKLHKIQK